MKWIDYIILQNHYEIYVLKINLIVILPINKVIIRKIDNLGMWLKNIHSSMTSNSKPQNSFIVVWFGYI